MKKNGPSKSRRTERTSPSVSKKGLKFVDLSKEVTSLRYQPGGGWFKKHVSLETIESNAFKRLTGFLFVHKYKDQKSYSTLKNVANTVQKVGDVIPTFTNLFFKYKDRKKSVLDNLYFNNVPYEARYIFDSSSKIKKQDSLRNDELRSQKTTLDYLKYLMRKPMAIEKYREEKQSPGSTIEDDELLKQIVQRTPFFADLSDYLKAVTNINNTNYVEKAHVYYILAEFYTQKYLRFSSLYNVELMTYYSSLFEDFNIKGRDLVDSPAKDAMMRKLQRLGQIKEQLNKGNLNKNVVRALMKDSSDMLGRASGPFGLVDPETGLPLDSPLLYYSRGGIWPFSKKKGMPESGEYADIRPTAVSQMTEILLNEPILTTSEQENDMYVCKRFEPFVTSTMQKASKSDKKCDYEYLDDLRTKMILAMRETRKNIILNGFATAMRPGKPHVSEDFDSAEHMTGKLEGRMNKIFDHYVLPVADSIDSRIVDNISTATSKLMEPDKMSDDFFLDLYSGASDLWLRGTMQSRLRDPFSPLAPFKIDNRSKALPSI